jgi:hypothetical protein
MRVSLYLAVKPRSSNHRFGPGSDQGSSDFLYRSSRVENMHFPWYVL